MADGKLSGRVALVTGASSGIGEATAIALAKQGAKVAITARRADRLEALSEKLKALGAECFAITADLLKEEDAQRIVDETAQHFGQIDILINNAGVMLLSPIDDANPADWRRMLELNLLNLMVSCQSALKYMRKQGDGHIVNISSTAGRMAGPTAGGYNASKWGLNGFSEAMRRETHKDGIRITLIEPGIVATELRDHIPHAETKDMLNQAADSMRQLQSEDIAAAIEYAVTQPKHVNVNEILIRPTDQER